MSIGTQFLARLNEEKKKGFEFDRGVEAMKKAMRQVGGESDLADKIAEVASMCGIPGLYLNKAEVRESVIEAAQAMRGKAARVRSFLALHSALKTFHGVAAPVKEAKGAEEELEGNAFQQALEEVLVSVGIPAEMVTAEAKAGVKAGLKRTAAKLRADQAVRAALIAYARYAGIKVNDGAIGEKKKVVEAEQLDEAAEDPMQMAKMIMGKLGVDLADPIFKGDNMTALERKIKLAVRNPNTKMAMAAFARVAK